MTWLNLLWSWCNAAALIALIIAWRSLKAKRRLL